MRDCAGPDAVVDVLVVGGGISGLWTLHALRTAGYNAWLIERSSLGDGQTIASQGILHAGAKYRLPGNAVDAARAVADVQVIWEQALTGSGSGVPDLSGTRVIDSRTLLWTTPGLGSRVAAKGARSVMRSEVTRLDSAGWPQGFGGAPRSIDVYKTNECVLDPGSLLGELAKSGCVDGFARVGEIESIELGCSGADVRVRGERGPVTVAARCVVLCAGEGNETLLGLAGLDGGALMQRRPLHQLVAIGTPFDLNGHCLQMSLDKPSLTVTTGDLEGKRTWYLGGGPSEDGVGRSAREQIEAGRDAISKCLPWVDHGSFEWRVFEIDRAEGRTPTGKRPSEAVVRWGGDGPLLSVWPTKLVLAPRAASMVIESLRQRGIVAEGDPNQPIVGGFQGLGCPSVAERVW